MFSEEARRFTVSRDIRKLLNIRTAVEKTKVTILVKTRNVPCTAGPNWLISMGTPTRLCLLEMTAVFSTAS